ncbi:MAG TPA: bifunctional metallophosphatase/5'-nucleotidase [Candidatus Pullichristensenella stercoripullorum]|nr:bifunctional metallophosphatase/5'-nucleotidase [Candidatus Pullichristensenella stercoripullorum]
MRKLKILYTSDVHGYLFPTNYAAKDEMPMGLFKLEAAFERDGNTLVIDGGDMLQGSPFAAFVARKAARPHPCALAMDLGGYQYVTLGNHDFNMGLEALEAYLNDLDAVCLCCNIRDRAGKLPILPYAVHVLENGLRVGLIGACTPFVRRWEKPETVAQLAIDAPIDAIRGALMQMPEVDVKVLVYHGGFERDLQTGALLSASGENQACEICRTFDFDVLLAGHQHIPVEGVDICGTHAVQPASNGKCFASVEIEAEEGRPLRVSSRLVPPASAALAAAARALAPVEMAVQKWLDRPAGHLDAPLVAQAPLERALNGSLLANFVNTVQLWASGADISACSLPNEFKGMGENVTVRDVVSTYVYANTLKVLRIPGCALRAYVEHTASYFDVGGGRVRVSDRFLRPKIEHYNYDFFSGMDYTIDLRRPVGQRVTSMRVGGREIAPSEELRLCVNSYRASGTGGYDMLPGLVLEKDICSDVSELIIRYIEEKRDIAVDKHRYLTVLLPDRDVVETDGGRHEV